MDTGLSDHSSLEGPWADHPDCAVQALPVVVQLNVLEHLPSHGFSGRESLAVNGLDLETVKEALGAGIVVTVALSTHAAPEVVPGQQRLVQGRTILATTVAMRDDALGHLAAPQRHLKRVADHVSGHALAHRPADHLA